MALVLNSWNAARWAPWAPKSKDVFLCLCDVYDKLTCEYDLLFMCLNRWCSVFRVVWPNLDQNTAQNPPSSLQVDHPPGFLALCKQRSQRETNLLKGWKPKFKSLEIIGNHYDLNANRSMVRCRRSGKARWVHSLCSFAVRLILMLWTSSPLQDSGIFWKSKGLRIPQKRQKCQKPYQKRHTSQKHTKKIQKPSKS